jgi:hypothetical protein
MNKISKIELQRNAKNAERQRVAAKMDYHLRRISEAQEAGNQHDVDRHDAAIRDAELRLHQMKKFV